MEGLSESWCAGQGCGEAVGLPGLWTPEGVGGLGLRYGSHLVIAIWTFLLEKKREENRLQSGTDPMLQIILKISFLWENLYTN
jgi:hypothetical protein